MIKQCKGKDLDKIAKSRLLQEDYYLSTKYDGNYCQIHKVGDEVIKFVGQKIKESIREVDFGFRYGGDEFVVMIFSQPKDIVLKIANRIFDKITSYNHKFGKISVSVGVAMYPDDNKDLKEVIKLADEELYIAKKSGKGKIESVN
jgi:diguanylate cyclase (GGDEF)-like protein